MSFDFSGYVLTPCRGANSNSKFTSEAVTSVDRDHKFVPSEYGAAPVGAVEPYASAYRTVVLDGDDITSEYLVWAANTGRLDVLESPNFSRKADPQDILHVPGQLPVGAYNDGTSAFLIQFRDGSSFSGLLEINIRQGGSNQIFNVLTFESVDVSTGRVVLDASTLAALGGGFSPSRGDGVLSFTWVPSRARFWWTRNDTIRRFGWNATIQRWAPLRGGAPQSLGVLLEDREFRLNPFGGRFQIGEFLPGATSPNHDAFALVRCGEFPDATSTIPRIEVVADADVASYTFGGGVDAVVGVGSGILRWDPAYVQALRGMGVWYNPDVFTDAGDGVLGGVLDDVLVMSPIPEPGCRPFIKIGSRQYLTPIACANDASLPDAITIPSGFFAWSMTTGKVVLSSIDVSRSTPGSPNYDINYLREELLYDGVALTEQPITTKSPVALVDASGIPSVVSLGSSQFIPPARPLPYSGVSGIRYVPVGSGQIPDLASGVPGTRINDNPTGLSRVVEGIGDVLVFSDRGTVFPDVRVVEYDVDIPEFDFGINKRRAFISRQADPNNPGSELSRIAFKRAGRVGEQFYFLQADLTPARFSSRGIYSRKSGVFTFNGGESFRFVVGGVVVTWVAPAGTHTASQVAASIQAEITTSGGPPNSIREFRGFLHFDVDDIEIGWNPDPLDTIAYTILGFIPGWKIIASDPNFRWLPDNGSSMGLFRSPLNAGVSTTAPDFRTNYLADLVLADGLGPSPVVPISPLPLLDIPGFAPDVHFRLAQDISFNDVLNWRDALYEFGLNRIAWLETSESGISVLTTPQSPYLLGHTEILPDTLNPLAMQDQTFGFFTRVPGATGFNNTPVVFPPGGANAAAYIPDEVSEVAARGFKGDLVGTVFTDPEISDWSTTLGVSDPSGYLLSIAGVGVFLVVGTGTPSELVVNTPAQASVSSWTIYTGKPSSEFNPAIMADLFEIPADFLASPQADIIVLTPLGVVTGSTYATPLLGDDVLGVRFGVEGVQGVEVTTLKQGQPIGVLMSATGLRIDTSDPFFIVESFRIRINNSPPTLVGVSTFPMSPDPDKVYYGAPGSGIAGELLFGEQWVTNLAAGDVVFDQIPPAPIAIPMGVALFDPITGFLYLSNDDTTAYQGYPLYITSRRDVQINPLTGGVYFAQPLSNGDIVEATYVRATPSGGAVIDPITRTPVVVREFLSNPVLLEPATPTTPSTWNFNPDNKTLDPDYRIVVWVGAVQMNFAGRTDFVVEDFQTIRFTTPVPMGSDVRVNYAVLEARSGSQSFTLTAFPVYNPPFFLEAGQTVFEVNGDVTSILPAGTVLNLGGVVFYIKSTTPNTTSTIIEIWPPPVNEIGTRAPGQPFDANCSSIPVAIHVDPSDPVAGGGTPGLLVTPPTPLQFLPVNRGDTTIRFTGGPVSILQPDHLLEIGGYPFKIVSVVTTDVTTDVTTSSPAPKGFSFPHDGVSVTSRPMYGVNTTNFSGVSPYLDFRPFEAFLIDASEVGRVLVAGVEYTAVPSTGAITLRTPLQRGQSVYLRYTAEEVLHPQRMGGEVINPAYRSKFRFKTLPNISNGILGATLLARYTYSSPDSYFYSVVPLRTYAGEVAGQILTRSENPTSGAIIIRSAPLRDAQQGGLGFRGRIQEISNQDRVARILLSYYNTLITAFEQIQEALGGDVIGDRDGKFRFFIGRGLLYPPPGYEDVFTGVLNPRLLWSEVFQAYVNAFPSTSDPLVDPSEPLIVDPNRPGRVDGNTPNPDALSFYQSLQIPLVRNDMDDIILIGFRRPQIAAILASLLPRIDVFGVFKSTWEPSAFSRVYPERCLTFMQTLPGINADLESGNPGFYSFGRFGMRPDKERGSNSPQLLRTYRQPIALFTNPVLGNVQAIQDAVVRPRQARARIWEYHPDGVDGVTSEPCIVATPVALSDFPIDPQTGMPDTSELISQGGGVLDLLSGDPELSTPPFKVGDALAYGRTNGGVFSLGDVNNPLPAYAGQTPSGPVYAGIYVKDILLGCYIVLGAKNGVGVITSITPTQILNVQEADVFVASQGDTIYVTPDGNNPTITGFSDPPTVEEAQTLAATFPGYRRDFDVFISKRASEIRDATLPSKQDPSLPLREWFGQRPPNPLDCVEADVDFTSYQTQPARIPALFGGHRNDSGDVSIPYLAAAGNESNALIEAASGVRIFLGSDTAFPLPYTSPGFPAEAEQIWGSIYPEEILLDDGEVVSAPTFPSTPDPGVLYTTANFQHVSNPYMLGSAIGNIRPYDLAFVQAPQGNVPVGATGVLTVGGVSPNTLQVPRFVSSTPYLATPAIPAGTPVFYTIENAFVFHNSSPLNGVIVTSAAGTTTFDFSSVGGIILDNGAGVFPPTGGLNWFFSSSAVNAVVIRMFDKSTDAVVAVVVITGSTSFGNLSPTGTPNTASPLAGTSISPGSMVIQISTSSPLTSVANSGVYYNFSIDVDTYITPLTSSETSGVVVVASGTGSDTANVDYDRLTFRDRFQMTFASPRGGFRPTTLAVWGITTPIGVSDINAPLEVNAGLPFTFPSRLDGLGLPYVGDFTPATSPLATDEVGTITVPAWEANGNQPLTFAGAVVSAAPSSDLGENSPILTGTGRIYDSTSGLPRAWVQDVSSIVGGVSGVLPGDVVVVDSSSIPNTPAIKSGTYLVRHAVSHNTTASDSTPIRVAPLSTLAGSPNGWVGVRFPVIRSVGPSSIVVDRIQRVYGTPSGWEFASVGSVYVITRRPYAVYDASISTYSLDASAVLIAGYSSFSVDPISQEVDFALTGVFTDASGVAISPSDFVNAISPGMQITGAYYIPIQSILDIPNNVVGYGLDNSGNSLTLGFLSIDIEGQVGGAPPTPISLPANIYVGSALAQSSVVFHPDPRTPIYPTYTSGGSVGVAGWVEIGAIPQLDWDLAHFGGAISTAIACLLPDDRVGSTAHLLAGVFMEPSFPRPVSDLGQTIPHVVDITTTANSPDQIGIRDVDTYLPIAVGYEDVTFTIRRIRRWHDIQSNITADFRKLLGVYEIRTGQSLSYNPMNRVFTSNGYAFNSPDKGIRVGDVLRVLDTNGELIGEAPIESILGAFSVQLAFPGIPSAGTTFEVYLQNAIVPELQSCEQLLNAMSHRVLNRVVDYPAGDTDGGFVSTPNYLQDTDPLVLGVIQDGDYIVVDPAGGLYLSQEAGAPPLGDQSVLGRSEYLSGRPARLDDNRGFYRVLEVSSNGVHVSGASRFGGSDPDGVDDIIYSSGNTAYAVLPTIHNSSITPSGREGQQTLRETAFPVGGSFLNRPGADGFMSIAPFAYQVLRPDPTVDREVLDLTFFMRERLLTWVQILRGVGTQDKSGSYYDFQTLGQIQDLGIPSDPGSGAGVMRNAGLNGVLGLIDSSPFANTSTCMSILDRRFWIGDSRLDNETPSSGPPYANFTGGVGRPVLPDLLEDAVEGDTNYHTLRYAWVDARANKIDGLLPSIQRAREELAGKLEKERQVILNLLALR